MKSQLKKIAQKLADKITSRKYEQLTDHSVPKVEMENVSVYRQLMYSKLKWMFFIPLLCYVL